MDIKELIGSVIRDLTEGAPISRIMLKAQAIAFSLDVPEFSDWIRHEQNGYVSGEVIPEYRRCLCSAKVNLTQGFKFFSNWDVPIDAIPDRAAQEMLSYSYFPNPISEIETMVSKSNRESMLKEVAPSYAYRKVGVIFPYANVDMLWKVIDISAASGIVDRVKSQMLDFFLALDKQAKLGIDFNQLDGKREVANVLNQTINAGVCHCGSGSIVTSDSIVGNNMLTSTIDVEGLKKLIGEVRGSKEFDENEEAQNELSSIEAELEQAQPRRKVLRRSLLFLKGLASDIGASLAAQYIASALGILG